MGGAAAAGAPRGRGCGGPSRAGPRVPPPHRGWAAAAGRHRHPQDGEGPACLGPIATRNLARAPPAWARLACAAAPTATPSMLSLRASSHRAEVPRCSSPLPGHVPSDPQLSGCAEGSASSARPLHRWSARNCLTAMATLQGPGAASNRVIKQHSAWPPGNPAQLQSASLNGNAAQLQIASQLSLTSTPSKRSPASRHHSSNTCSQAFIAAGHGGMTPPSHAI